MYCTNCGKQIKDGLKFCTGCGKAMGDKKVDTPKQKVETPSSTPISVPKNTLEKDFIKLKLNLKQLVIGIVAIIVLIIFIIVISSNHGSSKITSVINNNTQSVVDIWCDNGQGGSGTIIYTRWNSTDE